ncbi:uncharacterized protein LOC127705275 [Mytilus californianus]|uniref:uncharacterized protein LOC127705275 n=1 Tax=Mytilus californianus TaxID=6549 RepID=UPI0022471367|nr:uncharacterized protein LOC127705275 [Mytilus californianus]
MFEGLWSDNSPDIKDNYFFKPSTYGNKICSGGCNCNEKDNIVTGCSGPTVKIQGYSFENVTMDSFESSVTSIQLLDMPNFKYFGNATFDHLTNLQSLTIHSTSLIQFPDISTTQMEKMMLCDNQIKFFQHNHTNPIWPSTLKRLSLIQNDIEWVPDNFLTLSSIEYVSFSRNSIRYFPSLALKGVTSLIYLGLEENQIRKISKNHLSSVINSPLIHLNLSNNIIDYIEPNGLKQLSSLKILELHNNQISRIDQGTFDGIPNLIHLDLIHNHLEVLTSRSFTNLNTLITLRLHSQDTPMKYIYYDAFYNINGNLTNLWISDNELPFFPQQVLSEQEYLAMREIYADNNRIINATEYTQDGFPLTMQHAYTNKKLAYKSWYTLRNLNILYLGGNLIPAIDPLEFCNLTVLTVFSLRNNLLDDDVVPDNAFDCLTSLVELDIAYNFFKYVPKAAKTIALQDFRILNMAGNKLTAIPAGTFQTVNFTDLNLNNNKILVIENTAFPSTLVELNLQSNEFRFTHENPFTNLSSLRYLNLHNNDVDYIPEDAFDNCNDLRELTLQGNNIGWLTKKMFEDSPLMYEFNIANNDLAYIENGTFDHFTNLYYFYFYNNKLTQLPSLGDFSDLGAYYFSASNNRITEIKSNTFANMNGYSLDLSHNQISVIYSDAFDNINYDHITLTDNPMKTLESRSFVGITLANNLNINDMEISHVPASAFVNVNAKDLLLQNNQIEYIEENAFDNVILTEDLFLNGNGLKTLHGSIFANSSSIAGSFHMETNNIEFIPITAFDALTSVSKIYLSDNNIDQYPSAALGNKGLLSIYMENNKVTEISSNTFLNHGTLQILDMSGNGLKKIEQGTLDALSDLTYLDMSSNNLTYIEPLSFSQLGDLQTIKLADNELIFFPKLPNMTNLKSLDLSNNLIRSFEIAAFTDFDGNKKFKTLTLTGNTDIGCDCYLLETMTVVKSIITDGECSSPVGLAGISLDSSSSGSLPHFLSADPALFLCSPYHVNAVALSGTSIDVTWTRPNNSVSSTSYIPDASTTPWQYYVFCTDGTVNANAVVSSGTYTYTFTSVDGIQTETEYICAVALHDGSSLSAYSSPAVVTTQVGSITPGGTPGVNDWVLPIIYYDFSVTDSDFTGYADTTISKPTYIPSPYGAWLKRSSNPSSDTFSGWFVDNPGTNMAFNDTIILTADTGASVPTHRYATNSYFPIDGQGYGDQAKDCYAAWHNFGFTTAIRSGFIYQGNETLTVGGGDDVWVYLNGVLVLDVITRNAGTSIPCKQIDISAAATSGGATITPHYGTVSGSSCIITSTVPSDAITLELESGERYHFSIYHVERLACSSSLFIETTNFQFITDPEDEPPRDYVVSLNEDFHLNGIVAELALSDIFSQGPPFDISILRGNEARHFTLKDDTTTSRTAAVAPAVVPPTYTTIDGLSYVECGSPSTITPEGNDPTVETFNINTQTALFILDLSLDYEVVTLFTVVIQVEDNVKTPPSTGTITAKIKIKDVNDNCPELTQTTFDLIAVPSMQLSAIAQLFASDVDSDFNSLLVFSLSSISISPALDYNATHDLYNEVYTANTTLSFTVIVTDHGSPVRGTAASITFLVDNSCLMDVEYGVILYSLTVDNMTGEVFFRVPGYYYYEYECRDALGIQSGAVLDDWISTSSAMEVSGGDRARLNMTALDVSFGGLTGAWVPSVQDTSQWIQVFLTEDYWIHTVQIQGQEDQPNWVRSFYVTSSNDSVTWTTYTNGTGDSIFEGAYDQNSIVNVTLDPPVYGMYIRIHPATWNNYIGLRFELIGCSHAKLMYYKTTCQRCLTSWFCNGDSTLQPCGRCGPPLDNSTCGRSPTEHSFGLAIECTTCPLGWICEDGYATPCEDFHYVECNDTYCPATCTHCESGYACRGGQKYLCNVGTYSDGNVEFCEMCPPGTYQDLTGQSSCLNCPAGHYSSKMKDICNVCEAGTYAAADGSGCQSCSDTTQCPCLGSSLLCYLEELCYNMDGSFDCLSCPDGYEGNGVTCNDIDECYVGSPCWNTSACINTEPGYQCRACPHGYTGTYEDGLAWNNTRRIFQLYNYHHDPLYYQTCFDIDECAVNHGGCDSNSYCHNTPGSFYCGFCKEGYVGSSRTGCMLADFCLSGVHTCDSNAVCYFTGPEEYKCQCKTGWAGNGYICGEDPDQDGVPTLTISCTGPSCRRDNCANDPNSGQEDNDNDGMGDACDYDDDNDVIGDLDDNCVFVSNIVQTDSDGDGVGDVCDNCVNDANTDQTDGDGDGIGDICDSDPDKDGIASGSDNCPFVYNLDQANADGDLVGDVCDNCPYVTNSAQTDTNENGIGDSCELQDSDGDGIQDTDDNCPYLANGEQSDTNGDGTGDFCDTDIDGDGVLNDEDNCVCISNPSQTDSDGNHRGDVCESDYDQDGTIDTLDNCPNNKFINESDFGTYTGLDLNPELTLQPAPSWMILHGGKEIRQVSVTTKPVAYVGSKYFDHIQYSGTTYSQDNECYGYIGFIFGYQSTQKYYVALWRHRYNNMDDRGGTKGVQIRLIDSTHLPGNNTANALYHSNSVTDYTTLIWQDPSLAGWECRTSYRWFIEHKPSLGLLRVKVEQQESLIVDSGYIYNTAINGGRLGVFAYNQTGAIWSDLLYSCTERENKALYLNGSSYGTLGNLSSLGIEKSFTVEGWINLPTGYSSAKLPFVCSNSSDFCVYIENGNLHTQIGSRIVSGSTMLPANNWTHIASVYNAQEKSVTLYVNGVNGLDVQITDATEIVWDGNMVLYLGSDLVHYMQNVKVDDVRIYNIQIPGSDLDLYWQTANMEREQSKKTMAAHYNMNNQTDPSIIMDLGQRNIDMIMTGSPYFVESTTDYSRYNLHYN